MSSFALILSAHFTNDELQPPRTSDLPSMLGSQYLCNHTCATTATICLPCLAIKGSSTLSGMMLASSHNKMGDMTHDTAHSTNQPIHRNSVQCLAAAMLSPQPVLHNTPCMQKTAMLRPTYNTDPLTLGPCRLLADKCSITDPMTMGQRRLPIVV